jgi:cysteine desulfurase
MIRDMKPSIRSIYADYQASTPVDEAVLEAMAKYYQENAANPHARDHAMGWAADAAVSTARERLAACLGCDAAEVVFTSGATEANNLVILGAAARAPKVRKRILVSAVEHKCVLAAAAATARRFGCVVETLSVDAHGRLRMEKLERSLDESVLLVSVMAVNNEVGTIEPLAAIGSACARAGAIFHTDAAQALAAGPIDVEAIGASALSLSGHKIYGPKGIGALYLSRTLQPRIEPMIVGGGQQDGLRAGTLPVPLCVGLAVAAEQMGGPEADQDRQRVASLRDRFAELLLGVKGVALNGPPLAERHPGNCNLRFDGWDAKDLLNRLQPRLAASTGSACTSGTEEPSYVLRAIGLSHEQAAASIRFSFGRYSTLDDIEEAVTVLRAVLGTA